jgi:hypothetical protein
MRSAIAAGRVTGSQIGLATLLLVGVLTLAYGFSHPSKIAFYAGLFLTLGGVITGAIGIVTHGRGREAGA